MDIRMSNIASPMPQIRAKFTNKLGIPLSGCKVYTYEPNSDIPKTTWIDTDKTVENTNPILLDSAGEADIFLDGLYRIVVKDRFGFVVYDVEKTGTHTEWDASFVVDGDKNQKQINRLRFETIQSKSDLSSITPVPNKTVFIIDEQSLFIAKDSGSYADSCMVLKVGSFWWARQTQNELKLDWFLNEGESAHLGFSRLREWLMSVTPAHYIENASEVRKMQVDLCGKCWESSSEILINEREFSGLTFTNGTLKAKSDFLGTYLLRMQRIGIDLCFYYTYFDDVIFDGNNVADCAKVNNFLKCGFKGTCQFIRWKENGRGLVIGSDLDEVVDNPSNVHEVIGDQLVFMQKPYEDIWQTNLSTGTALINAAPDGLISNVIVSSAGKGVVNLRYGLNMYDKVHVYGLTKPDYGFYLDNTDTNFISIHLNNLYLDGCSLYILNPRQISLSASTIFRHSDDDSGLIIFDTNEKNSLVSRFVATNNTYNTALPTGKKEIEFRTTGGGTWNNEQNIQSFGNMYYGFVEAFNTAPDTQESWRTTSGTYGIAPKYVIDQSGTFTFDLKPYHKLNRGVGSSAIPSEWLILSSYLSNNGDDFGLYKLFVTCLPSGNYMAQIQKIGTTGANTFSKGFDAIPVLAANGVLTVSLTANFRGAIFRSDSRNTLSI